MKVDTVGFRKSHGEIAGRTALLRDLARELPGLGADARGARRTAVVEYLQAEIAPHMQLDERHLYPEVATRLGAPLAAASMSYDHLAIRWWIDRIAEAPVDRPEELQELLYGLDALIRVHVWKENELYLGMLDSPSWPARA